MVKVNIHDDQCMIGEAKVPSALCLLKVLIRESCLDSNATTSMIRQKLANLDEYLSEVENDITKFNNQVKQLLNALTVRAKQPRIYKLTCSRLLLRKSLREVYL